METIPCSVLILTLNAAATLPRCLRNLSPFAEVLVHDGNSTDGTVEIAKRYGARVLKQEDTDEPNIRVKDFTKMRLRQREDAACDWVLYLDADEELSDELIQEVEQVLRAAHEKVIVKVPRLPVVEGRVVSHGAFWPEIVPRMHHRRGGCTLQAGRKVHEKYVYDGSFVEITTHSPLFVPLDPLITLLQKDRKYIHLEIALVRERGGYPWSHYLWWILLREPCVIVNICLRICLCRLQYRWGQCLPLCYEWRAVRYHLRLLLHFTAFMLSPRRTERVS